MFSKAYKLFMLIVGKSRNVVNIFLYIAEQCKRYFPTREIPSMLQAFLPLLTKDVRGLSFFILCPI
jgi:hypothetical protein